MEQLLKTIPYMDEDELMLVIKETAQAWGRLKPETELVYISLPLHEEEERRRILQRAEECLLNR